MGTQVEGQLPVCTSDTDLPFEIKHVEKGIFRIRERFFATGAPANIWFVQGSRVDMIVDCGTGIWDLPAYLKALGVVGTKPIIVVATHAHFDHAGGLYQFENTAAHADDAETLTEGDNVGTATCVTRPEIIKPPDVDNWHLGEFRVPPTNVNRVLHDQDVIVLGDRRFEVVHLPGHTPGSIALLERKTGFLFSGDTIVEGPLVDWLPRSSVDDYVMSCQRLCTLLPFVKKVFPGRLDTFSGKRAAELCSRYQEKAPTCGHTLVRSCLAGFAHIVLRSRNNPLCYSCTCCCCGCC